MSEKVTKAALRYFGGKWKIALWIIDHFPPHKIYVEPFGGGASVLLQKSPAPEGDFYNDLDDEIGNFFRVCRDDMTELQLSLMLTPFAESELLLASEFAVCPKERARRTVIKSFMSYNPDGISRTGKGFRIGRRGGGCKPASYDWSKYPMRLPAIRDRLVGVGITTRSALSVIKQHDSEDALFYLDPPYVHSSRRDSHKSNYKHEMSDTEHEELIAVVQDLKGMVIISGYENEIYNTGLADWKKERVASHSSNLKSGNNKTIECIWMNEAVVRHGKQLDIEEMIKK